MSTSMITSSPMSSSPMRELQMSPNSPPPPSRFSKSSSSSPPVQENPLDCCWSSPEKFKSNSHRASSSLSSPFSLRSPHRMAPQAQQRQSKDPLLQKRLLDEYNVENENDDTMEQVSDENKVPPSSQMTVPGGPSTMSTTATTTPSTQINSMSIIAGVPVSTHVSNTDHNNPSLSSMNKTNNSHHQHVFISPPPSTSLSTATSNNTTSTTSSTTTASGSNGKFRVRVIPSSSSSSKLMKQRKVVGMTSPSSQLSHVDRMLSHVDIPSFHFNSNNNNSVGNSSSTRNEEGIHCKNDNISYESPWTNQAKNNINNNTSLRTHDTIQTQPTTASKSTCSILIPTLSFSTKKSMSSSSSTMNTTTNANASFMSSRCTNSIVRPKKKYGTKRRTTTTTAATTSTSTTSTSTEETHLQGMESSTTRRNRLVQKRCESNNMMNGYDCITSSTSNAGYIPHLGLPPSPKRMGFDEQEHLKNQGVTATGITTTNCSDDQGNSTTDGEQQQQQPTLRNVSLDTDDEIMMNAMHYSSQNDNQRSHSNSSRRRSRTPSPHDLNSAKRNLFSLENEDNTELAYSPPCSPSSPPFPCTSLKFSEYDGRGNDSDDKNNVSDESLGMFGNGCMSPSRSLNPRNMDSQGNQSTRDKGNNKRNGDCDDTNQTISAAHFLFSDDGIAKAEPPSQPSSPPPPFGCITPKSCPGAQHYPHSNPTKQHHAQLQTPLSSFSSKRNPAKTYQSPYWSEAVSVNPFSPVPPHHLHGASVCESDCDRTVVTSPLPMDSSYCSTYSPPPTAASTSSSRLYSQQQQQQHHSNNRASSPPPRNKSLDSPPQMPLSPMHGCSFNLPPLKPRKIITTLPRLESAVMERHDLYCPSPKPLPKRTPHHHHNITMNNTNINSTSSRLNHDEPSMILQPPKSRLDTDFQILATIGKGCFGTVHKVLSRLDGCLYAIKASHSSMSRHGMTQPCSRTALKEVHALAALCNQSNVGTFHIVRYHQAFVDIDELLYIQMELCECSLLEEMNLGGDNNEADYDGDCDGGMIGNNHMGQRRKMEEKRCWKILREILLALDLIHMNNMVHLDIKPENIFIKEDMYKLGDFGLASALNSGTNDVEEGDARYMAKELLSDHTSCDLTKCDIFSLGATVYEIYTRKPLPADGEEWQNLRNGIFNNMMDDNNNSSSTEQQSIMTILKEMMDPDPQNRPSAADLLHRDQLLSQEQQELLKEKNKAKAKEASIALQIQNLKLSDSCIKPTLTRRCST